MAQHSVALANAEWKPNLALTGNLQYQDDGVDGLLNTGQPELHDGHRAARPALLAPGAAARKAWSPTRRSVRPSTA